MFENAGLGFWGEGGRGLKTFQIDSSKVWNFILNYPVTTPLALKFTRELMIFHFYSHWHKTSIFLNLHFIHFSFCSGKFAKINKYFIFFLYILTMTRMTKGGIWQNVFSPKFCPKCGENLMPTCWQKYPIWRFPPQIPLTAEFFLINGAKKCGKMSKRHISFALKMENH